ncbi:MAG: hypothetical protein MUC50_14315 [Myxococcota bacterium]|nr:hypothetical protein [Myxococcota bacterium]
MKKQFEGDVASSLSAINVVIAVEAPGLPSKSVAEIFSASADIARTLGLEPVKEERVASAIKAKGRAPSGEADARAMAELLESGRVLIIRAATADKDVELSVLGLNARSGVSAQETKVVARASVTAQCRAMVVDVLAAMAAPPPPPPSQPVKVVAPVAAPSIEPPPPPLVQVPPPVVAPAQKPRPARTTQPAARGAAIFGVTVGVQAVSMALCYALNAELEHDGRKTDFMDWALGYSLVVPILSGTAGSPISARPSPLALAPPPITDWVSGPRTARSFGQRPMWFCRCFCRRSERRSFTDWAVEKSRRTRRPLTAAKRQTALCISRPLWRSRALRPRAIPYP